MITSQRKNPRVLGHLWTFFLPVYFLAAATLDPSEVTNGEYLKFILATRRPAPEYWVNGRYPHGTENEPVVAVTFHEATSYCRFAGRRLPTVDEWRSTCALGTLKKRGDIWEWTRPTSIWAAKPIRPCAAQAILAIVPTATCQSGRTE